MCSDEPAATIRHTGVAGGSVPFCEVQCAGPLVLTGIEVALDPAATAIFPTGLTQIGGGSGGSPRNLVDTSTTFSLRIDATGNLYDGFATFWADAGDDFCCPDGTPPLLGNPHFSFLAFEITAVPEPCTAVLSSVGLVVLGFWRTRRTMFSAKRSRVM